MLIIIPVSFRQHLNITPLAINNAIFIEMKVQRHLEFVNATIYFCFEGKRIGLLVQCVLNVDDMHFKPGLINIPQFSGLCQNNGADCNTEQIASQFTVNAGYWIESSNQIWQHQTNISSKVLGQLNNQLQEHQHQGFIHLFCRGTNSNCLIVIVTNIAYLIPEAPNNTKTQQTVKRVKLGSPCYLLDTIAGFFRPRQKNPQN